MLCWMFFLYTNVICTFFGTNRYRKQEAHPLSRLKLALLQRVNKRKSPFNPVSGLNGDMMDDNMIKRDTDWRYFRC